MRGSYIKGFGPLRAELATKVSLSGDTMIGALYLSGDPSSGLEAAPKQYVDSVSGYLISEINLKEDILTGAASSIAQSNLTAERALVSDVSGKVGVSAVTSAELSYLQSVTGSIQAQLNSKIDSSGGTLTGSVILSGDPLVPLAAVTKQYVDGQIEDNINSFVGIKRIKNLTFSEANTGIVSFSDIFYDDIIDGTTQFFVNSTVAYEVTSVSSVMYPIFGYFPEKDVNDKLKISIIPVQSLAENNKIYFQGLMIVRTVGQFLFTNVPGSVNSNESFNITVTATDLLGNTVRTYTGTIGFSSTDDLAELPASYTFVEADNGVKVFSIKLKTSGSQTITVSSGAISDTTSAISVNAGAASSLFFVQQPSNTINDLVISPAVTVRVEDEFENLVTTAFAVNISLGENPNSASISGTTIVSSVSGIATFNDLRINTVGNGYTFIASGVSVVSDESDAFNTIAKTFDDDLSDLFDVDT